MIKCSGNHGTTAPVAITHTVRPPTFVQSQGNDKRDRSIKILADFGRVDERTTKGGDSNPNTNTVGPYDSMG